MQPRCSTAQSTGDRRYTRGRHKLGTPRLRHHTPLCEANAGLTPHRASVDGPADRGGDAPRLKPMWPVRLYRWHYCLCVVDEKPIEAQVIASIGFWCAVSSPAFFVATIDDAQGEPQPGYRVYQYVAAGDCIAIVGPHSAARPKQRLRASPTTAADVSPTRRCSAPYTQRSGCASGSRACPETADAGPGTGPPTPTTDATPAQRVEPRCALKRPDPASATKTRRRNRTSNPSIPPGTLPTGSASSHGQKELSYQQHSPHVRRPFWWTRPPQHPTASVELVVVGPVLTLDQGAASVSARRTAVCVADWTT